MTVLAITPARGGSKGVPRKNIRLMAGKPLIQHTIEAARSCPLIDRYILNTEDPEIRDVAQGLGVETQSRPEEFWHDNTFQEVDRMLVWAVSDLEAKGARFDVVVLLYATSPLRPSSAITECIDLVLHQGYDSALTLREDRSYTWKKVDGDVEVKPTNYDPKKRGPNQLEGWNQWVENKAVYAMKRDLLMETGCRLGGRIGHVEMSKWQSVDIDTPDDFLLAEQLLQLRP
ncbi:MAG: cytidylyltransferase domain-containing protein [Cyanobacteriota bacterium]